jgi:hypothetical protein
MKACDLNDKQRDEFAEIFYDEFWPVEEKDSGVSCPWGCPWEWGSDIELGEGTIHEMVERFYRGYEEEILDKLAEELGIEFEEEFEEEN